MALTDENSNGMVMPVAPMYGGGNGGFGNGFGGDWAWIILLLLLGWGNNGNGFGGGYGNSDFPWLMTGQQNINNNTNNGFRDAMLNDGITSIRDGINGLSTQLCNCCGDMQMSLANGFAGVEQGANARQMANMQQAFAAQTAMAQGFNQLGSQFADCCCENRLANCQTQNIIQNEGNATRFADANNTRDIITNQTSNTQAILDKLCQLELDGFKRENDDLRTRLNMANLAASQTAQTAELRQSGATQLNQLVSELRSCPIPAQPVYGNQPIFRCAGPAWDNNGGCGCGCGCGAM
jgi:hypothetical protein